MSRFYFLVRLLVLALIFTLVTTTLNIQAAPLPQATGPDHWVPRTRDVESLPRLPRAEKSVVTPDAVEATTIYPWSRLVFQSIRDNNWEIYVGNDDGSGQTRLTYDSNIDVHPRLNRGATRIAFASKRTGNYEIYTMNTDGTGLTRLTSNSTDDVLPYWSPDGSKIAFQAYRDGQAEVYVMNADGSGQTRLTNSSDYDGEPAWSPDGTKIAFASRRSGSSSDYHIWVMNANGSGQTQLTTQAYSEGPVWSPDGTKIAYDAAGSDNWQNLWVVNADGSNPKVVFDESGYADAWVRSWSPDGRYIAFTRIYYIIENNQIYWTNAYLDAWDSTTSNIIRLSNNGSDWRPDWQTTDAAAPSSYVRTLPVESPATFTVRWSGSDTGPSGLKNFDIQVRDGVNGTWTTWQSETTATSASYSGIGGHTYYFRSRARDNAGNVEAWPASHDALTTVETAAPVSAVETLPEFSKDQVMVNWSGYDPGGSGIQSYDVQYQDMTSGGTWTNWQMGVVTTTASFAGTIGHTYAFRSRALDRAQNQEDWPSGNGDAHTTFYFWAISGMAHTNTGSPLVGINVTTEPSAQGVIATDLNGLYSAYVITPSNTYTVSWAKPGYGSLPATTFEEPISTSMISQGTLPALGDIVTVSGLQVGQIYRIVVTGTYQWTTGGGSWDDAQWGIGGSCAPGVFCVYDRHIKFNGVLLAAQNGQEVVEPNHEYTFLWLADTPQLQMQIKDSLYSDNSGYLSFEIFDYQASNDPNVFLPPTDDLILNGHFEQGTVAINNWIVSGVPTPTVSIAARHTGRQSAFLRATPAMTTSLLDGLISYWKLDEATGDALDVLGTNTLTATYAPGSTAGVIQGARTFSGDHQYFSIPTRPSVEVGNTSFTFTAWVSISNKTDYHSFVCKRIENYPLYDRDYSLDYDKDMDRFYFQVAGPDGVTLTRAIANALGSPTVSTWYFLAGGYDYESGYIWISVNGGPKETTPFTGSVHVGQAPFMLGGVANPLFGYQAGLLDEVGFWKRVLTPQEVASLYNNGQGLSYPFDTSSQTGNSAIAQAVTIPATMTNPILSFLYQPGRDSLLQAAPVAYWKLDETSGVRFDATGRGNDLLNTTIVTSATGKIGKAAQFVATNRQYLNLADNVDLSMGDIDFTIAGWVYLDAPKTNGIIVAKGDTTAFSNFEYALGYAGPNDRFAGSVGNGLGGGSSVIADTFGAPAANQWYFVAFWHDSVHNQLGISVNGIADVISYSGGVADGSYEFRLGDDLDGRWWNGRLDEIGLWKRVLTPQELAILYNNGQGLSYPFGISDTGGVLDVQVANGVTTTTVFTTALNATAWTHQWLDFSAWKGQTITVTFMLHDTEDLPVSAYLDEVTLGSGYPDTWVQLANPTVTHLGSTVTYQLTYGNQAGVLASDVHLTTTLPAQLTFVAASVPPTSTSTSLVWALGDLPAQSGPHTILITAVVTSTATSVNWMTNTASINTATTELEMANNTDQTNLRIKYDLFLPIILLQ